MTENKTYYSHGKLLLTGEYVVLDGAKALAIPTQFGQKMTISSIDSNYLLWESYDVNSKQWFQDTYELSKRQFLAKTATPISIRLLEILNACLSLNPTCFKAFIGKHIKTTLEFPNNWGLGSSSTLLNNIANLAQVDPFILLERTFGGSGYDIACAQHPTAIIYQNLNDSRVIQQVSFNPLFIDELFFVHLNKKQNSRDSISHYRATLKETLQDTIVKISKITEAFIQCDNIKEFETLIEEHEYIIANLIKTPTIKSQLFSDYPRAIKSLGGWGGDFILAVGTTRHRKYFKDKGFDTILSFTEMTL